MRKLYLWTLIVVAGLVFAYLLFKLPWEEAMLTLSVAKLSDVWVYVIASVLIRILLAWRWHIILRAKGITVPFWSAVSYRAAAFAVSFVTPGPRVGGEAVAAGLVSRQRIKGKKVKLSRALSTIVIDRSVEVQTFATMFFIGVLYLSFEHSIPDQLQAVLLTGSVILLAVMLVFAVNVRYGKPFFSVLIRRFFRKPKWQREVKHFEQTITSFYREDRKEFIASHLVSAFAWLVSIVEYEYLLRILGLDLPLYAIFIVYSFVGIAYLVPIPLAIGSLESSQVAAFGLIGLPSTGGILLALITRLRDIVFTIIGFMFLVYYGIAPRPLAKELRT